MKREKNNLDQLFRDGLRDYESPLAANLWDKLDAVQEENKKPKGIIWWKWGLGASLITLLLATAVYFFIGQERGSNLTPLNTNAELPIITNSNSNSQTETLNQTTNTTKDVAQVTTNNTIVTETKAGIKRNEALENQIISAKQVAKSYSGTTTNTSVEKSNFNSTKSITESPARSTGTNTIEENTTKATTPTSSSHTRKTKSNITQPIALETENELAEKVKATQRLSFLKTTAATLLEDKPDLTAVFTAPSIKIPFSWGPKGCYSFAGGRIKYDYYVDAFVSPEYVIRNLKARTAEDENYRQRRDDTEATLYGLSGGVRLSIVTRRGLALRTGIVYNRILERFNLEEEGDTRIVQVVQAGTMDTITTVETGTTIVRSYNRYHSIDIPLLLGYEIDTGKFNFSLNAGAYFNIYARQKGKILSQSDVPEFITSNNPQRINAFEKDLGISIYGSIGINYQIRPNLQLLIEPNLRYQLKPISLETYPLEQEYINIGLLLGVRRQF